jgi:pteridine reductase
MARELPLSGRTALVTGAAKRLGRATALALARAGADMIVHYRSSTAEAEAAAAEIRSAGRRAWAIRADLAEPAEAERLMQQALQAAGAVDILVNSASIFPKDTVLDFALESLARNVQVNAAAPLQLCRAFAAQHRPGHIVNFLDSRIVDYDATHAAYHLSKRMLFTLTRMLALELAPEIRVNAVAPGLILPPPGEDDGYLAAQAHTNPLNRHGSAEDITDAVLFLVRSRFLTGQVLFVDGGRHMKGRVYG